MAAAIVTWLVYAGFVAMRATRPPRRLPRAGRVRARDPRAGRRSPGATFDALARRHLAPRRARRAARAGRARRSSAPRRSPRALGDAVCLSTCNRTEVYLAGDDGARALASLEELAGEPLRSVAYRMHDDAAALHLFRVSAGLDSLIPGESEILGQVRAAFDAASPGPLLDRVFRQALQLGKRVRTETAIGESPASVPAAAAALAAQVFGDLTRPQGAARRRRPDRRARRRQPRGPRRLDRLRREPQRRGGRRARRPLRRPRRSPSTRWPARLGEVDVVLTSTAAPGVVIDADRRARAAAPPALLHRHRRPA